MEHPTVTFHPLKNALLTNQEQTLDVLVRVTAPRQTSLRVERLPLNLALVIDRSGSMSGAKIETAKRVALAALDRLKAQDRFSVVTFDNEVEVVVPSTKGDDTALARAQIKAIEARGQTDLHSGWLEGATQVATHLQSGHLNRVLLLSDGEANVGLTDRGEIAGQARGLAQRGVSTTTFGMDDDYDELLLEALATGGDGNYHYVEDVRQLEGIFDAELLDLSQTYGRGVSLGIEPYKQEGVTVQDVLNDLEPIRTGRYRLPNLRHGQPVEVLFRLRVPEGATRTTGTMLGVTRVRVAWDDPMTGQRYRFRAQLDLPVLSAQEYEAVVPDQEVEIASARLQIARSKDEAARALRRGDVEEATAAYGRAVRTHSVAPASPLMDREFGELNVLGDALRAGDNARARKLSSSQVYNRRRSRE